MNITEQIQNEIAQLIAGNETYDTYQPQWKYLLESYIGGKEYREARHLTRYQLESDAEYQARLDTTPLENHCASVISVYKSFLFRNPPVRDYGSIANLPELEDFVKDADMDGRSIDSFMKDVATYSSIFGHSWILITQPDTGAQTRGEQRAMGVRPYVSVLTPLAVLDWSWTRSPSGRYELDYLKYLEDVNGSIRTIKKWTKEEIKTYIVDVEKSLIAEETVETNQLGMIPAVCAYNIRSVMRGIGVSDITDIADAQKFIYNATSEVEQSIRINTHPSIVTTPDCNVGSGSGALIHMPEGLDPGLKPYLLEFNGASVDSIYQSIKHTIDAIDKMANTGAVRATESRTMSGVAMETEFQLLNAKLSEKADSIELAEEQMWKIWCMYMGYNWDGYVDYPGSFNIRDTGAEIAQLKTAKESSASPVVAKEIDKQILEWMEVDEAVINKLEEQHPTTTPETRTAHIQQMIMEGYTDAQILQIHPEITQADIDSAKQALLTSEGANDE